MRLLLLEDSALDADLILERLEELGIERQAERVATRADFEAALRAHRPDLILSDFRLPDFDGRSALALARSYYPDVPFILISGTLGEEHAVDMLHLGATDYVLKQRLTRLVPAVRRALGEANARRDRRDAELALWESQERLRLAVEAAELGTWHWHIQRRRVTWSERCRILYGMVAGTPITHERFLAAIHPDDRAHVVATQERALAGLADYAVEHRVVLPNGAIRWITARGRVYRDVHGAPLHMEGVSQDITVGKETESALRESETGLRLALEAGQLGQWRLDLITGTLESSDRCHRNFGLRPDAEFTYEMLQAMILPEDMPRWRAAVNRAISLREDYESEYRVRWPDGSVHWISARGRPSYAADGTPVAMAGVTLDVTQRRRMDEHLRQTDRLDAVGRLAGGIAHDLNNMLSAILGYSSFLARSLPESDARRSDVTQITLAATRSAALTRQLLTFARRGMVQPRLIDINQVVRDAERLVRSVLAEHIELTFLPADDLGAVRADPSEIEQALLNLVLNARDAMPAGGRVQLRTDRVTLDAPYADRHPGTQIPMGDYVRLSVTDGGQGMPPEVLSRIFEPFFTTKEVGKGTGLGLASVYGAMKQADGFVWAYSETGRGTTIKLYWPRVHGEAEDMARRLPAVAGGNETVLVVEDEATLRAAMVRMLSELGYRCVEASDAIEALALLPDLTPGPDLVVTDLVMPRMDGAELGNRIGQLRPGLPVLYTSGFAANDVVRRHQALAGRPFIEKPFDARALGAAVRGLLDGRGGGAPPSKVGPAAMGQEG